MVQTSCRTRTEEREHESLNHSGKCTGRKAWMLFIRYLRWIFRNVLLESGELLAVLVVEPLDLEVQVHIICALTQAVLLMLWISKRKEKNEEVALQHMTSPIPTTQRNTYPPWRISYLVQTYSTWPRRWSCPRSVPGETCKRQSAVLNPAPVMVLYYLTR